MVTVEWDHHSGETHLSSTVALELLDESAPELERT
jgi:hypothetical protein